MRMDVKRHPLFQRLRKRQCLVRSRLKAPGYWEFVKKVIMSRKGEIIRPSGIMDHDAPVEERANTVQYWDTESESYQYIPLDEIRIEAIT